MHDTTKPPRLHKGCYIGIVAPCLPALPSFRQNYEQGKQRLENLGFKIKEGKTVRLQHWYSAGTPQQQADDIKAMFADDTVRAIIATSGGYSAISVLELLDYQLIRSHPKPFIGMSDMSAYHLALYTQTGLVGFHMDDIIFGLGSDGFDKAPAFLNAYLSILTDPEPLNPLPHLTSWEAWRRGATEGKLIGGNLHTMTCLMGTPYFPKPEAFDDAILFWEEVGRPRHELARSLYQLKYYGVLKRINGMLIGTITDVPPISEDSIIEPSVRELILEITKPYKFPILAGVDFGHYTTNLPMPLGIRARFDTHRQEFTLLEGAVTQTV